MPQAQKYFSALVLMILVALSACQPATSTIKYTASCSGGSLSVSYVDAYGNSQTYIGASPWQLNFSAKSGAQLSVSGNCGTTGTCTVHIYINGTDKANDTENGLNATATTTVP